MFLYSQDNATPLCRGVFLLLSRALSTRFLEPKTALIGPPFGRWRLSGGTADKPPWAGLCALRTIMRQRPQAHRPQRGLCLERGGLWPPAKGWLFAAHARGLGPLQGRARVRHLGAMITARARTGRTRPRSARAAGLALCDRAREQATVARASALRSI